MVTHQIPYLYDCDQVIIMNEGSVGASGTPHQLRAKLEELSQVFRSEHEEEVKEEKEVLQQRIRKMSAAV